MIYSPARKLVFIHIPKTGGTAISSALVDMIPDAISISEWRSIPLARIHGSAQWAAGKVQDWDVHYSIGFVRNPWDRMVSIWTYITKQEISFPAFMDGLPPSRSDHPFIRPQAHYLCDPNGQLMVSFVGRFESLDADFRKVAAAMGGPPLLKHLNKSKHLPYEQYYSPRLVQAVADRFLVDVSMFGYAFGANSKAAH